MSKQQNQTDYCQVALPVPLTKSFTYESTDPVLVGCRVKVNFNGRPIIGVVTAINVIPETGFKIRKISEILDSEPVLSAALLEIGNWMSRYYLHPIGEVLRTMLPASTARARLQRWEILASKKKFSDDHQCYTVWNALRQISEGTELWNGPDLKRKIKEALGTKNLPITLGEMADHGLIRMRKIDQVRSQRQPLIESADSVSQIVPPETPKPLTQEQMEVVKTVIELGFEKNSSQPFLLRGVTGSGKTETYLHLIAQTMHTKPGSQSLVMVPEISLTPQMTQIFDRRFPGEIAVVHSALDDDERWEQLEKIRRGDAKILIGPRSAVFAPFHSLGLVIVDEEHDSSYKQTTGLCYHGRDIAILRSRLEKSCIVLGSATPSLESFRNALEGKYILLEMNSRATGRPLPDIEVVECTPSFKRAEFLDRNSEEIDESLIAPEIVSQLKKELSDGHQAMVIVNRRGYAYYLYSYDTKSAVVCPNCSISLTLHKKHTILRCHYCDYAQTVSELREKNPETKYAAVGYGSQRIENLLQHLFPALRIGRVDSDSTQEDGYLANTLAKFRAGELDILVGTQMLAKGHDFPNVTVVAILEADQLLNMPDFRAGERLFQLLVQAAGRAGRHGKTGKVLIQSCRPDHGILSLAIKQEFKAFALQELDFRKKLGYPPFNKLVLFEFNSEDPQELERVTGLIDRWLNHISEEAGQLLENVRVSGPAPCPLEVIRGRHRKQMIFSSTDVQRLHLLTRAFRKEFRDEVFPKMRIKVDVDPYALL